MILPALVLLNLVTAAAATAAYVNYLREKRRRTNRAAHDKRDVPLAGPAEIDAIFALTPSGPARASEAVIVGNDGPIASTSEREAWILAALAKSAKRIFEFGTAGGRTTYLLARNAPADARVTTLTLPPDGAGYAPAAAGDARARFWKEVAVQESRWTRFYYTDTEYAPRIDQRFGDSTQFDESAFEGQMDLIFIDGGHVNSIVRSDTEKALRMLAPGGLIVWHDYSPACPGVYQTLNALQRTLALRHVAGTRLVVHRDPRARRD